MYLLDTNVVSELRKQQRATALIYDLTIVTRNTRDFSATGVKLLDPFE